MRLFRTLLLSTGTLLAASLAVPAYAETVDCAPVTSLPTTISTQGIVSPSGSSRPSVHPSYSMARKCS